MTGTQNTAPKLEIVSDSKLPEQKLSVLRPLTPTERSRVDCPPYAQTWTLFGVFAADGTFLTAHYSREVLMEGLKKAGYHFEE